MNWEQAKTILRDGGKITRPNWANDSYWILSGIVAEKIIYSDGTDAKIHLKQIEANDWEIWREKEFFSMEKSREFEQDILNVLIKHRIATKTNRLTSATIEIEANNMPIVKIGGIIC